MHKAVPTPHTIDDLQLQVLLSFNSVWEIKNTERILFKEKLHFQKPVVKTNNVLYYIVLLRLICRVLAYYCDYIVFNFYSHTIVYL